MLKSTEIESFTLDIFLANNWISFLSIVLENLQGNRLSDFYELLFRLSAGLNGFKLGVTPDGNFIVLQSELDLSILNDDAKIYNLHNIIKWFYLFYLEYYPKIVKSAYDLDLRFRNGRNPGVDKLMKDFTSGNTRKLSYSGSHSHGT